MKFKDDGDFARAIGFVSIYMAYVEDELASRIEQLNDLGIDPSNIQQYCLSDQAKYLLKILEGEFGKITPYFVLEKDKKRTRGILSEVVKVAKERNKVVHGVYIGNKNEVIIKNRRTQSSLVIKSKHIYKLAERIDDISKALIELKSIIERLIKNN